MFYDLEKILTLVRRTGDRLVVADRFEPWKSYVVIGIEEYEKLIKKEKPWLDEKYREPWDEPWEDVKDEDEDEPSFTKASEEKDIPTRDMYDYHDQECEKDIPLEYEEPYDYSEDYVPDVPEFREEDIDFGNPPPEFLANNRENFTHIGNVIEEVDKNKEFGKIELKSPKERWSIPKDVKEGGSESIIKKINIDEEDRYYLESI